MYKVAGYRQGDEGAIPSSGSNLSFHFHIRIGSGTHLSCHPMGTEGSLVEVRCRQFTLI